jgi:spore coat-associated protein N
MSPAARPEIDDLLQEMIEPSAAGAADRARRRRLAASVATVGLGLVGITSLTTSAVFTDNDAVSGGGFTTGTVDVTLEASPETFLRVDSMVPGDVVYQPLTVRNDGSLQYRYAVEKSFEDVTAPLSTQLQLAVYAVADAAACTADGVRGLEPLRAPAPVAAGGPVLLGDPATGQQDGDRLVVSTDDDVLCFGLYLPLSTGDEFQASAMTLGLKVWAEQSAHND